MKTLVVTIVMMVSMSTGCGRKGDAVEACEKICYSELGPTANNGEGPCPYPADTNDPAAQAAWRACQTKADKALDACFADCAKKK